jgi:hypothetical protein
MRRSVALEFGFDLLQKECEIARLDWAGQKAVCDFAQRGICVGDFAVNESAED